MKFYDVVNELSAHFDQKQRIYFRNSKRKNKEYDLQHDLAWVADVTDHLVVLAPLQADFLGKCDHHGLGPRCWLFSCLPNLVADCRESGDYILSSCLDQFCWDVVDSS